MEKKLNNESDSNFVAEELNISYRWTQHIFAKIIIRVWSVSLLDRTKKPVAECPTLMKRTIIIGNEACVY